MLFFSTAGRAFELKVWRLPEGTPQSRGKPMVNMLPLQPGERIATVMPLPEPEERENLNVLFATSKGEVRRNLLSDFLNIKSNGKIAMKLEDEQGNSLGNLIAVMTCTDEQHALLATRAGKSIRFNVSDVRVFSGRSSTGVRGVRLADGDEVISMSLLNPSLATPEQARDYLRVAVARRRAADETVDVTETPDDSEEGAEPTVSDTVDDALSRLGEEMFAKLAEAEEFILSVTENGFGKRSSAYEYRTTGRGGQGIANMDITAKTGGIVASFPVKGTDQIMLVTDGGQLIRTPIRDVRIVSRRTQGVMLLRVDETERVVSVTRLEESADEEGVENELGDDQVLDGETPSEEGSASEAGPGGEGEA
jgi:DNA gyrase subunit A